MPMNRKKVFEIAKHYKGRSSSSIRIARNRVEKGLQHAYVGRKLKRRAHARLAVTRVNAACRAHGFRYSNFKDGLWKSGIELDRKTLAELAVHEPHSFKAVLFFTASNVKLPVVKIPEYGKLKSRVVTQKPYKFVEHEWMEQKKLSMMHARDNQRLAADRLLKNVAQHGKIPVERPDEFQH